MCLGGSYVCIQTVYPCVCGLIYALYITICTCHSCMCVCICIEIYACAATHVCPKTNQGKHKRNKNTEHNKKLAFDTPATVGNVHTGLDKQLLSLLALYLLGGGAGSMSNSSSSSSCCCCWVWGFNGYGVSVGRIRSRSLNSTGLRSAEDAVLHPRDVAVACRWPGQNLQTYSLHRAFFWVLNILTIIVAKLKQKPELR